MEFKTYAAGLLFTDRILEAILHHCPESIFLYIPNCTNITNTGLSYLESFQKLEDIYLNSEYGISNAVFNHIRALPLTSLTIKTRDSITYEQSRRLLLANPAITLDLINNCNTLSDDEIELLKQEFPSAGIEDILLSEFERNIKGNPHFKPAVVGA